MTETSRVWFEANHWLRKLASTIHILSCLGMARTFGEYRHSVWDGRMDYAVYVWRGREWAIPTRAMDRD